MYVLIYLDALVKKYIQWQIIALQMIQDMVQSAISSLCDALGKIVFWKHWKKLEYFCSTNVSIFLEFLKKIAMTLC